MSGFLLDLRDRSSAATGSRRIRDLGGPPVHQERTTRRGDPADPVFAALREWRLTTARTEGIAAFVVAHDAVLAAIAESRPQSLAALRRVKGMGPSKLEKYGDDILEVLQRVG
jgi:superfamily II DNA helicase RecQ